jgi:hypothetical protein
MDSPLFELIKSIASSGILFGTDKDYPYTNIGWGAETANGIYKLAKCIEEKYDEEECINNGNDRTY